jgi:transposase
LAARDRKERGVLRETEDTEEIIERVAALDIGKAELVACVRVPSATSNRRMQEVSTHSTMTRSLLAMADHFARLGITRVIMEATSDYWKPVYYLLEAYDFEVWLVNARDVKHLPGRPKTDRIDAVWLAKVAERQMIRPSFVPPPEIRRLRDLTRYRVDLVNVRTAEKNRAEKLLEDACIKLSSVATDIFGVSGRDMMRALIAGQRDPKTLAQLARARMRVKIPALEEAFTGHFSDHHGFLLDKMLARVDGLDTDIAELDRQIEQVIAPFASAVQRLSEIPGVKATTAHTLIAEIGVDMSRFPTAGHLASWAKFTPTVKESAGKKKGKNATGPRQHLPGPDPGRGSHLRRQDRHLPRRTLPAHRQTPRQEESHRRRRPVPADHHLASAVQPSDPLPRPRPRLLRHPHRPRTPQTQPHPRTRNPRLHRHPRTRRLTGHQPIPAPPGYCRLPGPG